MTKVICDLDMCRHNKDGKCAREYIVLKCVDIYDDEGTYYSDCLCYEESGKETE